MTQIPVDEAPVGLVLFWCFMICAGVVLAYIVGWLYWKREQRAKVKYFIGQEEVDLPFDTQFKMGPKGETYIVLPSYTYIGGPGEGAKIYLEDDTWLMLQPGTVFENVTVIKGKGDDENTD